MVIGTQTISWKKKFSSYALITVGTFLMAAGTNLVYEPLSMVTGGFAGIGIILRQFVPLPLWLVTAVLNVPLFLVAARKFGMVFVRKTLYATASFSLALALIPSLPIIPGDYLMAALLGGALNGAGLGLVFGRGASTGGSDLLSTLLQLLFPATGTAAILSFVDGAIVVSGMLVFGIRTGLYSIVAVFVTTRLMDRILEGLKFAKLLYIISDRPDSISTAVMEGFRRGVTALRGRGMYSGSPKNVLMCAVSRKETPGVIQLVKKMDERAFIIISDVREIMGEGFETYD